MSVSNITIGSGVTFGAGITVGTVATGLGAITYAQMNPPVIAGNQLEDGSATINDPVGFTINNGGNTGVAVGALTQENITYFNNLGKGTFTATLGAGSTYATISVDIINIPSDGAFGQVVFFFDSTRNYPATFNYPISIS